MTAGAVLLPATAAASRATSASRRPAPPTSPATLTGEDQERWLAGGLNHSPARWNVIAQQVMMSRIKFPNPTGGVPPIIANLDQWDGYAPQRARLLQHLVDARSTPSPCVRPR